MGTVDPVTSEAVEHALDAAQEARHTFMIERLAVHVRVSEVVKAGARGAIADITEYLFDFAATASHTELIAEIEAIHNQVQP